MTRCLRWIESYFLAITGAFGGAVGKLILRATLRRADQTYSDGVTIHDLSRNGGSQTRRAKVSEALKLVAEFQPTMHGRVRQYIPHIVVLQIPIPIAIGGAYWHGVAACFLDREYVDRASTRALALTIVHEAAHARICRLGVRRSVRGRIRRECACIRAEIALAERLPNAEELAQSLRDKKQALCSEAPRRR
jgi:hypothetical protein